MESIKIFHQVKSSTEYTLGQRIVVGDLVHLIIGTNYYLKKLEPSSHKRFCDLHEEANVGHMLHSETKFSSHLRRNHFSER